MTVIMTYLFKPENKQIMYVHGYKKIDKILSNQICRKMNLLKTQVDKIRKPYSRRFQSHFTLAEAKIIRDKNVRSCQVFTTNE